MPDTQKVVYCGPSPDGVEIADAAVWADTGEPVEVPTDLAENLLDQSIWAKPGTKAAKEAKERGATFRAAQEPAPEPAQEPAAGADEAPTTSEEK